METGVLNESTKFSTAASIRRPRLGASTRCQKVFPPAAGPITCLCAKTEGTVSAATCRYDVTLSKGQIASATCRDIVSCKYQTLPQKFEQAR